jgi:hypothetical protein
LRETTREFYKLLYQADLTAAGQLAVGLSNLVKAGATT